MRSAWTSKGYTVNTQTQPGAQFAPRGGPSPSISLQFEPGPSAASAARNALYAIEGRLEPTVMDDVRLLVSELVTNSVRHSHTSPQEAVELEIDVDPRTVRVEVRDHGTGFEPRRRGPDKRKVGGWGLYLVEQLADRWGVACNSVTRVWFEIDQSGSSRARTGAA